MNHKFIETFIWVAKLHSFSLAADKLHSTQAAISNRISVLEQDLGTKLFTRDPNGVLLTRAGERVLQRAEEVSECMARLRAALQDDNLASGTVRIGAMDSAIHSWFVDFVTKVTRRFPNLDIEVTSETALNLNEQLRRGMLDMVIQTDMLRDETIRSVELLRLPIDWVVSSSFPLPSDFCNDTPTAALRSLGQMRLITFSRHSRPHQDLLQLMRSYGVAETRVNCVNSVAAMIRLTQAGFGVAAMPRALVPELLASGVLRSLGGVTTPPPMPFVVAWRAGADWTEQLVQIASETASEYAIKVCNPPARLVA